MLHRCYIIKSSLYDEVISMCENQQTDPIEVILQQLMFKYQYVFTLIPQYNLADVIYKEEQLEVKIDKPQISYNSYEIICINREVDEEKRNRMGKLLSDTRIKLFEYYEGNITDESKQILSKDFLPDEEMTHQIIAHYGCWNDLIDDKIDFYILINDNVSFSHNFKNVFDQIINKLKELKNWDIIYFGYHMTDDNLTKNIATYRPEPDQEVKIELSKVNDEINNGGLFGYAISKSAARKLIDFIKTNPISDNFHKLIINNQQLKLEQYESKPHIIFSANSSSKSSSF